MTREPSREQLDLAARVLAHECAEDPASGRAAAAARMFERLFLELAPLIGSAGVIALFSRAVMRTKSKRVAVEGLAITLEPLDVMEQHLRTHFAALSERDAAECAVALWAMLVSLMANFIGEPLTLQVIQRAWPAVDVAKESK
jgi:hypothetical protein